MIQLIEEGRYKLFETKGQTKILVLGDHEYAWIPVENIGEILVSSHHSHEAATILAVGNYRLYTVLDEPRLTDLLHLELFVGEGIWQGYLLPTGLPDTKDIRNRIIPTSEVITKTTH